MLTIRKATEKDVETIFGFIVKMAEYERLENEVDTSPMELRKVLFMEHQAQAVIAEVDGNAVGMALYFFNFSTFKGRRGLWLEDLFVDKEQRGKGYGKALLLHLTKIARECGCRRMEWSVLDWNTPSIEFYRSLGAQPQDEWTTFRLQEDDIERLANL